MITEDMFLLNRAMLFVLALLILVAPCAMAGNLDEMDTTRKEKVILEGMEEEIETRYFSSERGYSFWYDPEVITRQPESEGVDMDRFRPTSPDAIEGIEMTIHYYSLLGYTFEQAKKDVENTLQDNYGEFGTAVAAISEAYPYEVYYAHDGDSTILRYVIDNAGEGAFNITVKYPTEAAEGYGSRIEQMIESFQIMTLEDSLKL